jgi:hypothetical protein
MAKLVFGMNQSLDGYVDHMAFAPSPTLFRHFIEEAQGQAGSVYGRQMYEVMRYWDDDHPEWGAEERAFAAAWRKQPKWVVSRTLKTVGPNATLVEDGFRDSAAERRRVQGCQGSMTAAPAALKGPVSAGASRGSARRAGERRNGACAMVTGHRDHCRRARTRRIVRALWSR